MKYFAGIDLGGTFIECGIADEAGNILIKDKIPTGKERPYTAVAHDMAQLVRALCTRAGVAHELPGAAGIGSPGTADGETGVIAYNNNLGWHNVPIGKAVGQELALPVFVANDANVAALGESFAGAGAAFSSSILITLGTGVGGGIVLDGRLFEGKRSAGAEIGHMVIRAGGVPCTCGRRGCFEAYASATALIRRTRSTMLSHPESAMWQISPTIEAVNGITAFDGMRRGDKTAERVVRGYIDDLAEGVANLINIFRPDAIILGGGISAEGETLLSPLRKRVRGLVYGDFDYAPTQIVRAVLGNDAGLVGAAHYADLRSR